MKVSEIKYERYTIERAREVYEKAIAQAANAKSACEVLDAYKAVLAEKIEMSTWNSLAYCRFTLNTKDEFYQGEVDYYDENGPLFNQLSVRFNDILLENPFRAELERDINPRIFKYMELEKKCFADCVIEDIQEENAVATEYSKFMAELLFDYEGEKMPFSRLVGKLEDADREVRRKTAEVIGRGFGEVSDKLDGYYDRLVKIRTRIARKLGYKNFVELGYYRMGRLDYDADMVARFRENVKRDLVPVVDVLKEKIRKDLGIGQIMYYDNSIVAKGPTTKPVLDTAGIFDAAQDMYDSMNPEIGAFMRSMREAEAFDVESRDGKTGGGYCTGFAKFKQPFILANFNGSCGDIDVITHEFGHALAAKFAYDIDNFELEGGMETAECHSMSMEFFCWKYIDRFFGNDGDKYRRKHLLDALSFIPYGVIVDEFQHIAYENPDFTPAQRNAAYKALEEKYRPYLSYEGVPYLENGTRWQFQHHIYEVPFYYVDYCLAQTVSLGFLVKSLGDYDGALQKYLEFARCGGTKPFAQLVKDAGLASPFEDGALKAISDAAVGIVNKL